MSSKALQKGFSLIELAVVLVIIGLLIGSGIAALDATQTQTRRSEQKRQLAQVREALYGFAMVEGRLPCPDGPDDDGLEDRPGGDDCAGIAYNAARGALPWATLGLGRRDAWGNPLYYAVTADYADKPDASESDSTDDSSFVFKSTGNLVVYDNYDESAPDTQKLADQVPAVVLSFGPQGKQVWGGGGLPCTTPPAGFSQNETENCGDDPNQFVDAGFSTADSGNRFDDIIVWLSDSVLKARMVDADRLP